MRCMPALARRALVGISVFALFMGGCGSTKGSAQPSTGTFALPPAGDSVASLEATARAWARAFLVGSVDDIHALQGPECKNDSGTTIPVSTVNLYVRGLRAAVEKRLGRRPDRIAVIRVDTRNVTSTTGEALVVYDLPPSIVGNDNWVSYAVHDGRWKVADCHAPILGSSSSKSSSGSVASRP